MEKVKKILLYIVSSAIIALFGIAVMAIISFIFWLDHIRFIY